MTVDTKCPVCGGSMDRGMICCNGCSIADVLFVGRDEQHARAIHGAVFALNGLIEQARRAGLSVELETENFNLSAVVSRRWESKIAPVIGAPFTPDVWE